MKDWIKCNRHQRGKEFFRDLNRRLRGHYNYYGIIGNSQAIDRFYFWSLRCTFKWLNRRGGQRKSYEKEHFMVILKHVGIARPRITQKRLCKVYA
ncbi:MAG: maturase [Candidatus Aegiribacteria sp.]|nr:maturase [Candidatus Aegiribacteria sp.]